MKTVSSKIPTSGKVMAFDAEDIQYFEILCELLRTTTPQLKKQSGTLFGLYCKSPCQKDKPVLLWFNVNNSEANKR